MVGCEKQRKWLGRIAGFSCECSEYKVVAIVAEDTNYKSASAEKIFHISQANNAWKEELSIIGWTYGEQENVPNASAQFGTVTYSYCDSGKWYLLRAGTNTSRNLLGKSCDRRKQ